MAKRSPVMTKADILDVKDLKVVRKPIKAWDNREVCFREISGEDGLAYNDYITQIKKDNPDISAKTSLMAGIRLLSMMLSDEEGNLQFTEEEVKALGKKSLPALMELISCAAEVAGVSSTAIAEAKNKLKNAQTADLPSS